EMQGVLAQALVDAPPFRDHTYRLRVHFRRDGYETKTVERTLVTGTRPERLDVHLDRERSASGL
ncbi:MAG TPA: hypothetical protein VLT33_27775, partial [Labilithrix sp.]|nr:hypothetical protein [Labilithrix sp.]